MNLHWSLYIDAIEGNGTYLGPKHVYRMTDEQAARVDDASRAGYAASVGTPGSDSMWRFNADLGLISVNSNNIGRISRALQGEAGLDEIVRDLRLRPVIKVSVRYAF